MNILITGISGFLGKKLAIALADENLYGLGTKSTTIEGVSVFSSNELEKIELDIDLVILCHAAISSGIDTAENTTLYNVNVALTERIANKFNNAFLIYISSVSIYDPTSDVIYENSYLKPQSNYALSKLWGERIISENANYAILRISSMFGVGMKENTIIPIYVNQAIRNGIIKVWGTGQRRQNYIFVEDVVNYIKLIIQNRDRLNKNIFLGVDQFHHTNLELAQIISRHTGCKVEFINEDNSLSVAYNNNMTVEMLKWKPNICFEEQLQKYIEWKRNEY